MQGGSPILFRHVPNTVHAVSIRASNCSWFLHVVGPYYLETDAFQGCGHLFGSKHRIGQCGKVVLRRCR